MKKTKKEPSYIEHQSLLPFIEHTTDYDKCGPCLKTMIRYEVAKEFCFKGETGPEHIKDFEKEVTRRCNETFIYKEMTRLISSGLSVEDAILEMQKKGYDP